MSARVVFERRGAGEPLVLLHGIGHRWQAWQPVIDRLAERHDVIAIDLPGFGSSPELSTVDEYSVESTMDNLVELFGEFGVPRPHIAGNSLGGMLALELASRGVVRSATALSPAGFWTARDRAYALATLRTLRSTARHTPAPLIAAVAKRRALRALAGAIMYGRPSLVSPESMVGDMRALATAKAFDAVAHNGRDYFFAADPPTVPVTVAWGTRDRILWPRQAREAARLLPAANHVPLPRCGHVPMSDDPRLIANVILDTCRLSTLDKVA
ncbi:alpha/beta fold hydrolase [Herbihabitans rhizosphaerae]|nr:alpha/beta hydrolase [Herbihabitans rhizosphaerae]